MSQRAAAQNLSKGETMSMTLDDGPVHALVPATMTWVEADSGFWVGNADGAFGGSVDRIGRVYRALDPQGAHRGDFRRLSDAQRCLETFFAHPAAHGARRAPGSGTIGRPGTALAVS